jgi:hypothetical protein
MDNMLLNDHNESATKEYRKAHTSSSGNIPKKRKEYDSPKAKERESAE